MQNSLELNIEQYLIYLVIVKSVDLYSLLKARRCSIDLNISTSQQKAEADVLPLTRLATDLA